MKKQILSLFCALLFFSITIEAQKRLVAENAKVQKLADGFIFTEGPTSDKIGNVYFTDNMANKIYKWSIDNKISLYDSLAFGCNGLAFDANDELFICGMVGRNLLKRNIKTGTTEVIIDKFEGKRFNSPNDLCFDKNGGIYFTDPRYGKRDDMEFTNEMSFYYHPKTGVIGHLDDSIVRPNGILCSNDGKTLYIADRNKGGKLYQYTIDGLGKISNKKQFANQAADGMTIDEYGNLYLTTNNIKIYSPQGNMIDSIVVPEMPSNVTFGGKEMKTLFITARKSLYSIEMNVKGNRY